MSGIDDIPQPIPAFQWLATFVRVIFGRFVPAGFFLGGLLFFVTGILGLHRGWRSRSWPAVQGRVVASEVLESRHRDSDGQTDLSYRVQVEYSYSVDGRLLSGDQFDFGGMSHDDRSSAQHELRDYPVGRLVQVYYSPDDPSVSVLNPGMGGGAWIAFGMGSVFSLVGAILFFVLPRMMAKPFSPARDVLHG